MPNLGRKYTCYSCHTKFYDLGKPTPMCPKCGADQRDADEAPVVTSHRGRRVVEVPVEDDIEAEEPAAAETEEDDLVDIGAGEEPEVEEEDDDDEEEY